MLHRFIGIIFQSVSALMLCIAGSARADSFIKSGEKIAFFGDSIAAQGWSNAHGYVKLVVAGPAVSGVRIQPMLAGVGGNKSNDMLARLKWDVIEKKPDWVAISCGMNDVIHGARDVPLDVYKGSMTDIIAHTVLASFGLTDAQLAKARNAWLDLPDAGSFNTRVDIELNKKFFTATCTLTLRQRERVLVAAAAKRPTLGHWSKELLFSLMKEKVNAPGPFESLDGLFAHDVKDKVQADLLKGYAEEISEITFR